MEYTMSQLIKVPAMEAAILIASNYQSGSKPDYIGYVSAVTGRSMSSVREYLHVGKKISPCIAEEIRGTFLVDNFSKLEEMVTRSHWGQWRYVGISKFQTIKDFGKNPQRVAAICGTSTLISLVETLDKIEWEIPDLPCSRVWCQVRGMFNIYRVPEFVRLLAK